MNLVQIVITRKDKNTFRVTTFSKRECNGGKLLSERETVKLIAKQMKRLGLTRGLEGE